MAIETLPEPSIPITTPFRPGLGFLTATPIIAVASACLALVILSAIFAPLLSPHDPQLLAPAQRLRPASAEFWLGTDAYGRDVLARILYGGRISLLIGLGAAVFSIGIGLVIGLVSGFFRWVDAVMMRVMDGLMAIPSILLAIAVVSLSGASLMTVLVAITIPEIPRVARLVRSVVLSAREEPYVEAAISVGSSLPKIMWRHLMPNTVAPLIVQGTYVAGLRDPDRGDPVVPRRRHQPGDADLGQHHGRGPRLFPDQAVADLLARPDALGRDPQRQSDRRRRARRARSPHEAAGGRQVTSLRGATSNDVIPGRVKTRTRNLRNSGSGDSAPSRNDE